VTGDLSLALVAGMLATVNPCGFALLPGYLTLVVAGSSRSVRVGRALLASALMTAGFVAVFGIFGLISTAVGSTVERYLPVVTVVVGVALVVVGVLLLAGREPVLLLPKLTRGAPTARVTSMLGYGVAFAIASLSCTIGPFLAVAGVSLRHGDPWAFLVYGLGMGLVVGVLALAGTAVARGIRRVLPYVSRIGGGLLLVTGLYVGYYGCYELRVYDGGDPADPVVDLAGSVQGALSDWLRAAGPVPFVIVLIVGLILVRAGWKWRHGTMERYAVDPDKDIE
jgi:cytochrome c biogenesis protein CcdA